MTRAFLVHELPHTTEEVPVLRWDLAWALFLPTIPHDIPSGDGKKLVPLAHWFWDTIARYEGRLRQDNPDVLWCVLPHLSVQGLEFVRRLLSFWVDEIYELPSSDHLSDQTAWGENLWCPPTFNVFSPPAPGHAFSHLREVYGPQEEARYAMPLLGMGRAFMRVEVIPPHSATARLHSHSAVDEYYLVLSGRATLRMGSHQVEVGPGDLIAKPTGPDLTSHLVTDLGESLSVLDMEIWPDNALAAKDLVHYPDTAELFMRGPGWRALLSDTAPFSANDILTHYDDGYLRQADGQWTPKNIPGTTPRKTNDQ